jgi:hypothetical protein
MTLTGLILSPCDNPSDILRNSQRHSLCVCVCVCVLFLAKMITDSAMGTKRKNMGIHDKFKFDYGKPYMK